MSTRRHEHLEAVFAAMNSPMVVDSGPLAAMVEALEQASDLARSIR
ncbi:hypothetical protein [Sinorhizobium sp. BG8]|nr:hypothetical protein [Sinorhizobium sp. BG8]